MKKLIAFFLFFICFASPFLNAQKKDLVSAKDKAIIFRINGLGEFGFSSFSTSDAITPIDTILFYGLGIKYYVSDNLSLISSLLFGYNFEKTPSTQGGWTDQEKNATGIGVLAGLRRDYCKI
jgi:hypothetical protein